MTRLRDRATTDLGEAIPVGFADIDDLTEGLISVGAFGGLDGLGERGGFGLPGFPDIGGIFTLPSMNEPGAGGGVLRLPNMTVSGTGGGGGFTLPGITDLGTGSGTLISNAADTSTVANNTNTNTSSTGSKVLKAAAGVGAGSLIGSLTDLLFGTDAEPSRVEDVRSPEQIQQQQDVLNFLVNALNEGGFPQFTGTKVAPLSELETNLLRQLTEFTQGGFPSLDAARSSLTDLAGGGGVNPILERLSPETQTLTMQQISDILTGQSADPNDPRIQAAITAATRPIIEQFQDQFDLTRGQFTQAGQFVQPGSSSPFELASSRLHTGLANALGDTGARIIFDNLNAERGRQTDLIGLLSDAFESGQERRLDASVRTVPFEKGQLEGFTSALDTAALPRLIEQFGLTAGQSEFTRQQDSLLEILRLLVGGNQPEIVSIPGSAGGGGILDPLLGAAAQAFGEPAGTALAKAIGL